MQALNLQASRAPARIGPRMEHRFGWRYPCGAPVRISGGAGLAGEGLLLNVSMSGACIQTALDLPPSALVSLTRIREDDHTAVELLASVVRRTVDGVGVEWCETPGCSICRVLGCPHPCHP